MTDSQDARELQALLTRQRDAYCRLRDLARAQRGAIESRQGEALLRVLGDRQRQLGLLTEITRELEPYRSRWSQMREGLPPDQRRRVADLVAEVERLLSEILERDEGDCLALQETSLADRRSAAAVALGRQVNAAYAASRYAAAAPQLIDRDDRQEAAP